MTSAISSAAGTAIQGTLNSLPGTTFRIEFFSNGSCDPSGFGEGEVFAGSTSVTTNGSGNASFNVTVPVAVLGGRQMTATATDPGGNTSEFSACRLVVPTLTINDVTVSEAAGNATFTITLAPGSTRSVSVSFATANGTATAPADYAATSGTRTFVSGTTTQTVSVPIVNDTLDEPDETFLVNLTTPSNAVIGDAQGVGTITDDDVPPTPTFTPTRTSTATVTPSRTPTGTRTPTFTSTRTRTSTVTRTFTSTRTPTFTATPTRTPTRTFTLTPSRTQTSTATRTHTATATGTRTRTPSPTRTLTASATLTPTLTSTGNGPTSTRTPTRTVTRTMSLTATLTPTITVTRTRTATRTATRTRTRTVTVTVTSTRTRTRTATRTPVVTVSRTTSVSPSRTRTPSPAPSVSVSRTTSVSRTSTRTPTVTPGGPTLTPTPIPVVRIESLNPNSGPASGGMRVTLLGANLEVGATVAVGGVSARDVVVVSRTTLTAVIPALLPGTLNDVVVENPDGSVGTLSQGWFADFADVPDDHPFHDFIEKIFRNGITAGCGEGRFCPEAALNRSAAAVLLLKSRYGPDYLPRAATGGVFSDVPAEAFAASWIEDLALRGISGGCGGSNFCPDMTVSRSSLAVLLLRTRFGPSYVAPFSTGAVFQDVPVDGFAARWIEDLAARGMTGGCGGGNFCPNSPVTRGQMAVLLSTAFDLR